jgi:hypothetical protein
MAQTTKALTRTRISTTKRLSGLELPACFTQATVASAANAHERKTQAARAARRRLDDKVARILREEGRTP